MRTQGAELVRYKDARRNGHGALPLRPKSAKKKPVILEFRYTRKWKGLVPWVIEKWRRFGRYRNQRIAQTVAMAEMRKHPGNFEFKLQGNREIIKQREA